MRDVMKHEFGHILGMETWPLDKYDRLSGIAFPGSENDVMGDPRANVQEQNIKDVLNFGRPYLPSNNENSGAQGCMAKGGNCWN